jgi:hypothetical protein
LHRGAYAPPPPRPQISIPPSAAVTTEFPFTVYPQ